MRPLQRSCLALALVLIAATAQAQTDCPCTLPNVGGTAALMPACAAGYVGQMQIVDGLPAGSTIEIVATLKNFAPNVEVAGGTLGGYIQTFDADLQMQMAGTGVLSGFNRFITMPVSGVAHSGPRTAGNAVQTYAHDMISLTGEVFGDPDFCNLSMDAGSNFLLPSPGLGSLDRIGGPGTDFDASGYFDLNYALTFQGCPGSVLEGQGGTTTQVDRLQLCDEPVPVSASPSMGTLKSRFN